MPRGSQQRRRTGRAGQRASGKGKPKASGPGAGRPSVPLDRVARLASGGSRRAGPRRRSLDPASSALWLGLGVLLVALVYIVATAGRHPSTATVDQSADLTKPVDGIACLSDATYAYTAAAHLDLFLRGRRAVVPTGIGSFGSAGSSSACEYALVTRDTSGVIHVQAPAKAGFTLGEFFDIWGMPLTPTVLMGYQAMSGPPAMSIRAYVSGRLARGNPRDIGLSEHAEITLEYGPPWVAPQAAYAFPKGD